MSKKSFKPKKYNKPLKINTSFDEALKILSGHQQKNRFDGFPEFVKKKVLIYEKLNSLTCPNCGGTVIKDTIDISDNLIVNCETTCPCEEFGELIEDEIELINPKKTRGI